MTLGQKQRKFVRITALLLHYAHSLGYELTIGRGHVAGAKLKSGAPSLHADKLAIDWNLFIKGPSGKLVYQTSTKAHEKLGMFWEYMGGSWGGRFDDGNHYSLAHTGRR